MYVQPNPAELHEIVRKAEIERARAVASFFRSLFKRSEGAEAGRAAAAH